MKSTEMNIPPYRNKLAIRMAILLIASVSVCQLTNAQTDTIKTSRQYKNVIRYNISNALLFGIDKYIVFGYERVIGPHQSISINVGKASLPKLVTIETDSFTLSKDSKSSGFNVAVDYRFYLQKENKYLAPHGLYIGPYYSYTQFNRDNEWNYKNAGANSHVDTKTEFKINTIGFELGYQFVLWKRLTLDLLMVGPGIGIYDYKAQFAGNVDAATKEQLLDGLKQLVTQKFPGMNWVFSDQEISSDGTMKTTTLGYRYVVHIGFAF